MPPRPMPQRIKCPFCHKEWTEKVRSRGSCPGCGAGLNEMLYAFTVQLGKCQEENNEMWHSLHPESMGR